MIQVRRIGHATFETPDLDKAVDYYAAVNGLTVIGRGDRTAYLASRTGLLTIALQRADAARCARLTFEVAPDSDLAAVQKDLAAEGVPSERRSDPARVLPPRCCSPIRTAPASSFMRRAAISR